MLRTVAARKIIKVSAKGLQPVARSETPDLLGEAMPGPQPASTPARPPTSLPPPQPASKKVKSTYYVGLDIVADLDQAWLDLRQQAGRTKRRTISRSAIVEIALAWALADLEEHSTESLIARTLARR
jgi:hypothetical protein